MNSTRSVPPPICPNTISDIHEVLDVLKTERSRLLEQPHDYAIVHPIKAARKAGKRDGISFAIDLLIPLAVKVKMERKGELL